LRIAAREAAPHLAPVLLDRRIGAGLLTIGMRASLLILLGLQRRYPLALGLFLQCAPLAPLLWSKVLPCLGCHQVPIGRCGEPPDLRIGQVGEILVYLLSRRLDRVVMRCGVDNDRHGYPPFFRVTSVTQRPFLVL
jgi:hypothetical protein